MGDCSDLVSEKFTFMDFATGHLMKVYCVF